MFGPLTFKESCSISSDEKDTECLLCKQRFDFRSDLSLFLIHIFEEHHLVIEGAQNIDNFEEYIRYWKEKFSKHTFEEIVPKAYEAADNTKFYLLSDLLKEDKEVRHKLKLENILKVQEFERNDASYTKQCLYCKFDFEGKRADYLSHLRNNHNLRLGNPQNLVFIDELIEKVNEKLTSLVCLFCEKIFPSREILKEHMRKKQHKRINPTNCAYDKFYAENYLNPDRSWDDVVRDAKECGEEENFDDQYKDWNEAENFMVCLFCPTEEVDINKLFVHMSTNHKDFNFEELIKGLDFYERVKFVNYVRRQVHKLRCVVCDASFENHNGFIAHMEECNNFTSIVDSKSYDQPEFYFPTYENDALLIHLEDVDDNSDQ